jgi:hypothetical protein
MNNRKLLLKGLKGYAFDAWSIAVPFALMCIALIAMASLVGSVFFLAAYYAGLTSREDFPFPNWAFVPAHFVARGAALIFSQFWKLPKALKKRAEAFEIEQRRAK